MKIYVSIPDSETRSTFLTPRALAELKKVGEVMMYPGKEDLPEDELVKVASDAEVIFCCWGTVKYTKELVERLPNLKIIAYVAGTMAMVVEPEALSDGRVVALTGNYMFAKSVAEGCIGYMLSALRRFEHYMHQIRTEGWWTDWYNRGLYGKRIGLVGFGEIAQRLVELLKPFHTEIWVNSGHLTEEAAAAYGVKLASREEIFSECDIVSLHLALSEKTIGCIDRRLLSMLKPDALFINTARARMVDEEALVDLLKENRFTAMLDVFTEEPVPLDHPYLKMENVMLMPHMAGPTIDMREQIVLSFVEDLKAFQEGKPMENLFKAETLSHMTAISI